MLRDLLSRGGMPEEKCIDGSRVSHELVDVDIGRNVLKEERNKFTVCLLNEEKEMPSDINFFGKEGELNDKLSGIMVGCERPLLGLLELCSLLVI